MPVKACSFLPAATQMIYDMGLQHLLFGVTFECPAQALMEKPYVVRYKLEGKSLTSEEINSIFSASKAQGESLYYVDEDILNAIEPDVIFTQDVCEVCQIDTACTADAISRMKNQPRLVPLTPQTLDDVWQTALTIATALGHEEVAYHYLAGLNKRVDYIMDRLRANKMPLKRVLVMEWMKPVYNCGHWIPYQVAKAGGVDMLSNPGGDSIVVSWEKIRRYNPEVLVVAPCGFSIARSLQEINLLTSLEGWNEMRCVQTNEVYVCDFDLFTQPSPSTLTDGIEILAAMFHPSIFDVPPTLKDRVVNISKISAYAGA